MKGPAFFAFLLVLESSRRGKANPRDVFAAITLPTHTLAHPPQRPRLSLGMAALARGFGTPRMEEYNRALPFVVGTIGSISIAPKVVRNAKFPALSNQK